MSEEHDGMEMLDEREEGGIQEEEQEAHIDYVAYEGRREITTEFPKELSMRWMLISAILAGLVIDLTLINHHRGVNILISTAALIAVWIIPLRKAGKSLPAPALSLFTLMSLAMFFQSSGPVDVVFLPLWVACGVNYFFKCRNILLGLEGMDLERQRMSFDALNRAIEGDGRSSGEGNARFGSGLKESLPGLIVAVPISIILISLLVAADKGFEMSVSDALGRLDTIPTHAFWTIVIGGTVFAVITVLALARKRETPNHESAGYFKGFPLASSGVVLGTVAVILAYFLIVHLQTLTLSEAEIIKLTGSDFRTYLRRGFAELVTAEIIIGTISIVVLHTREWSSARLSYRALAWASLFLTGGLAASCAARLYYYCGEYGLSLVRSVNIAGIVLSFLCIGFLAMLVSKRMPINRSLGVILQMSLIVYVVWSCTFPVVVISRYNAGKYLSNHILELEYLEYLGPDAYPALATVIAQGESTLMPRDRDALAMFKHQALSTEKELSEQNWLEWSPLDSRALSAAKLISKSINVKESGNKKRTFPSTR